MTTAPHGRSARSMAVRALLAGAAGVLATSGTALSAAAPTAHPIPAANVYGVTAVCGPNAGFGCTADGYNGTSGQIGGNGWAPWQYWSFGSPPGAVQRHNCTTYAAYRLQRNGVPFPGWTANARDWDTSAQASGTRVDQTPAIGAIAQWNNNHVAYVENVTSSYVEITDDSYGANVTRRLRIPLAATSRPDNYIHYKDIAPAPAPVNLAQYANTLVRVNGDTVTTWFVSPDLRRLWVPDGGTYQELKARGFAGPFSLPASTISQLPDQGGQWVASGASWGANRELRRGMSVRSSDGRYLFALQGDGNLVLYGPSGRALWATSWRTGAWQAQEFVIFQGDGNLVTYGGGRAIWASGTGGRGGNQFVVQSDGNLVIYASGRPIWASNTAGLT